jgi:lipopolysaccharide/colanic/teichoic acid biosynthesis glycosyltransferase
MTVRNLRNSILTADLVWGVLAMPLAYLLRYGWVWHGPTDSSGLVFIPPLMATLLVWSVMSSWTRLDGFRSGWLFSAVVSQVLLSVSALMCALFSLAYLLRQYISRLALSYFGLLLFSGFLIIRLVARRILVSRRTHGLIRKVVIVGNGPVAREMVSKIASHPEMLREVVGFLTPADDACPGISPANNNSAITVQSSNIADLLESHCVDEIVLTVAMPNHPEILELTSSCRTRGIAVSMVPQPYELYITKHELTDLDGVPLLQLLPVTSANPEPFWKRPFDICMTVVLLPICLVPMVGAAALLKFKKGRAFCTERRFGKNGVQFPIFRLNCPRATADLPGYERWLQKLSIPELPQLFNALRGDMSLVGPRPEGPDRTRGYTDWHRQRLKVKPGITGLAQVYGLRHQHSSENKTRYDLQYILHRSFFLDISLLVQTVWTLVLRLVQTQDPDDESNVTSPVASVSGFQESFIHADSSQPSAD